MELINILSIDKGIPPLSFEKMDFFWLEPYLQRYSENLKKRISQQEEQESSGKQLDPSSRFNKIQKMANMKPPKMKSPNIKFPK